MRYVWTTATDATVELVPAGWPLGDSKTIGPALVIGDDDAAIVIDCVDIGDVVDFLARCQRAAGAVGVAQAGWY